MEQFEAQCQEKIHGIKKSLEAELQTYKEHVRECIVAMNA